MNLYLKTAKSTIIICCLFILQTATFAQSNIRITIKNAEITLQNALIEVEKQSKLSVAYNQSQLSDNRQLSLNIVNQPLDIALKTILKGTGFSYKLTDKYIMIIPEKKGSGSQITKPVKGKIVDEKGEPLIGVNVAVDGTTTGTITDLDGNFSMSVLSGSTLKVSYIGYATRLVAVSGKDFLNITMHPDNEVLDEVVVTALGIKRETKSLTYNVQEMKAADLTTIKDASFMNSLAGKIAGVTINQSASGIGGSTRVVMRGLKSITNDNNALYVIDGIPMASMRSNQEKSFYENADGGDSDGISSINPDDIESMSVLTGAAAAALYGSQGANGVVLITTKKGEEGKLRINYSNDTQFTSPLVMPEFQTTYGSLEGEFASWGNKKDATWEVKDFFQTGFTETNSLGLSAGNDRNQTYFSAASTNARGIIPNNTYNRYNFTLRNTTELIKDKLTLDMSASYVITNDNNMMPQGQYHNPLVALYLMPRGDDLNKYKIYERYDSEKYYDVQYWPYGNQGFAIENPYWIVNRENMSNHKSRYMFSANLNYKVFDWMSVVGRMRIDNSNDTYERKISASSDQLFASEYGNYMNMKSGYKNTYGDAMAQINKRWENWGITANIGASFNHQTYEMTNYEGHLATVPNFFSFNNISKNGANTKAEQAGYIDDNQAVFATFQLGYKSWAYLDLTARNDWFSTLANTDSEKSGFFYPSVGLSWILNKTLNLPGWISFSKVRASWAQVGNDLPIGITSPAQTITAGGVVKPIDYYFAEDLKPEISNSIEVGTEWKFFNSRLDFDFTFYRTDTKNQLIRVNTTAEQRPYRWINAGKIRNTGVEITLGATPLMNDNFRWKTQFNFATNKNKIVSLGGTPNFQYASGNVSMPYKMMVVEGGSLGDIYGNVFVRDANGKILLEPATDKDGNPNAKAGLPQVTTDKAAKIGNFNPDWTLGWSNTVTYKGFSLYFLIDARVGGDVISLTQAGLDYAGVSKATGDARDAGYYMLEGQKINDVQKFYQMVGDRGNGTTEFYRYDGTNIRLREVSLGYSFPQQMLEKTGFIKGIDLSLVARNLFFIYKDAPFDPDATMSVGNDNQGLDTFGMPSTRNIGFNIKFTF